MMKRGATSVIKTVIFTVLVPGTVTVVVPRWLLASGSGAGAFNAGWLQILGVLLIALGASGYLWCAKDFALAGQGTPAPTDPPRILVVRGLYRVVRNPMYTSVLLVLVGEGVLFGAWVLLAYAAVFWLAVHSFVLFYEEPALQRRFGEVYEEYRRGVSRWIPHLPQRRT
ncbi:MAG: methyltransferase family protein [Terriglobia bacterium]